MCVSGQGTSAPVPGRTGLQARGWPSSLAVSMQPFLWATQWGQGRALTVSCRIAPGPNWAGSRACYPGRPRRWQEPTHWGYYHDVPLGTCTGEKMKLRTEPQHSSAGCRHPNSWADHPLGMFLLNPVGSEPYRMTLCNLNYFHLNTAEWGDAVLA